MRVLFDTNVVLDLLLDRPPWSATAAELLARVEGGSLDGYLGATTLTTIYYLATKTVGAEAARQHVGGLLALCQVAAVDRAVLAKALALGFGDFEDAVLHEAARSVGAEAIVTRDPRGFRKGKLLVLTPEECTEILNRQPS